MLDNVTIHVGYTCWVIVICVGLHVLHDICVGSPYVLGNSYPTHIPCSPTCLPNIHMTIYVLDICVGLHGGFVDVSLILLLPLTLLRLRELFASAITSSGVRLLVTNTKFYLPRV